MRLDFLRPLYERKGPFVSIYLDTGRTTETGATEIELRRRRLSEHLVEEGATAEELIPIADLVGDPGMAAPGRAVFVAGHEVVYTEALPAPPRREIARRSPLPHVMPLLAQRGENVPHLRVLADHTGADVVAIGAGAPRELVVGAEDWPLQKTGQGGWSQKRYERGVETTWERNAVAVAETIDQEVRRLGAELVILAGEPKSRMLVREHVGKEAASKIVMVEHGSRAPGAAPTLFAKEAEAVLDEYLATRRAEVLDAYGEATGHAMATQSLAETVDALRERRVRTLLIVDDASADGTLWIGEQGHAIGVGEAELRATRVTDPIKERADAALVRAAATTGADLWFVSATELHAPDGVAALLRF
ncbi:Vms1/Ankzf1 family peptidyl-tRNA hydrolase [Thermopolyspora sp. NPDC052614]|uniref:baeRF2 domain-containing protein n=1 Tax=Thermopolyspora sp. NPDC052614 TaxID=3155682 RepID=UPI0034232C2E